MTEKPHKIEQQDIIVPSIGKGETAVVFQRHGKYIRDRDAENAGSLYEDNAEVVQQADEEWFQELLSSPQAREITYFLFVSSDTQYAGKGFRSLETGQLAQDAAKKVMLELGIDANEHIINFNDNFKIARSDETDQDIRPLPGIREPDIFNPDDAAYIHHLQETHGYADEYNKTGISPKGWAFHEMDAEKAKRETTGAEGQEDLIDRTKASLAVLERYARVWHVNNPDKKLVIWATSHYDTINPLVKEIDGCLRENDGSLADTYQPVDYGGGIVLKFPSREGDITVETRKHQGEKIDIGRVATRKSVTRLGRSRS